MFVFRRISSDRFPPKHWSSGSRLNNRSITSDDRSSIKYSHSKSKSKIIFKLLEEEVDAMNS